MLGKIRRQLNLHQEIDQHSIINILTPGRASHLSMDNIQYEIQDLPKWLLSLLRF